MGGATVPFVARYRKEATGGLDDGALEPLSEALLEAARGQTDPAGPAAGFVNHEMDVEAALAGGARDILAERFVEHAPARARLRRVFQVNATFEVRVLAGKEAEGATYRDYFDHEEPAAQVPSHRMLAILRGEREGVLVSSLRINDEDEVAQSLGLEVEQLIGEAAQCIELQSFVDPGVKRDGLVHISQLSDTWVDDPRSVLHVGRVVKVTVLELDQARGRISLSMKADGLDHKPRT